MNNIKKHLKNCEECPLLNQHIVLGETNCQNLSDVKLFILAEAPALEEMKQNRPLVGRAGQIFRKAFELSNLCNIPYFITNSCLCTNLKDNKTYNPPEKAVQLCRCNWENILNKCNPDLILIMGSIPMKSLGIAETGITKLRGNIYDYKGYKVFLTTHPSFILRKGGTFDNEDGQLFLNDFKKVHDILVQRKKTMITSEKTKTKTINNTINCFNIADWCYSDKCTLYDIQNIREKNEILYIFKKTNGGREYISIPNTENYFYVLDNSIIEDTPTIMDVGELRLIKNEKYPPNNATPFEQDIKIEQRHSIDYRYNRIQNNISEPIIPLKIQFMDIELYNDGEKSFPSVEKAEKSINSISFLHNDTNKINVYILKTKKMDSNTIEKHKDKNIVLFESEKELLTKYFEDTAKWNPDVIAAWNGSKFDYPYIYNRCKKIGVNISKWSPIGIVRNDEGYGGIKVMGSYLLDLLELYKRIIIPAEGNQESYKLDFISKKELGTGKVAYEGTLDVVYETDINKFIEYSSVDTFLLKEIDDKRKLIDLLAEMIRICATTWYCSDSTMGLIDPLILLYAKKKNMVCRNAVYGEKKEYEGAYVNDPNPSLYKWIVDLDFTSLYPSIISTYNIDIMNYIAKVSKEFARDYIYNKENLSDNPVEVVVNPWKKNYSSVTVSLDKFENMIQKNKGIISINGCVFKGHEINLSFIGEVCQDILKERKIYKEKRKKYDHLSDEYQVNNNRQLVYKILANSIYGVLASKYFRFFNVDLAEAITLTGQEVNKFSQYHTGNYMKHKETMINKNYHTVKEPPPYIIYGDTDSLFISIGEYLVDKNIIGI